MRKIIAAVAASALMLVSVLGFTACGSPDAHEHVWNEGEITTQPTCTQEGVKTFNCTVKGCKETMTETVSRLDHTYGEGVVTQEPTCKEAGTRTFTCGGCGGTYTEQVEKTVHSWDGGNLSVIPSLNAEGEITYTCTVCETTKKEPVAPRADFGEQFYNSLPSDSEWGYGYTRNYNDETGDFDFIRITSTDENEPAVWKAEGVEISAGAITSAGNAVIAYGVTSDCGVNLKISFAGEEDNTRVGAVLIVADGNGSLNGGKTVLSEAEKDWNGESENLRVKAGSCIYIVFMNEGEGAPKGSLKLTLTLECVHTWDDGVITTQPACDSDGVKTFTCGECGETYTEAITERPPHEWTETGRQEATADGDGYIDYKCDNCNQTKRETLPATSHVAAEVWTYDNEGHWHNCTAHNDCTVKLDEDTHTKTTVHDESGHHEECTVCGWKGEVAVHVWNEGEITVEPTFTGTGEIIYTCACGETKTQEIPAVNSVDFVHEFTAEEQTGAWSYGHVDYSWEGGESFVFHKSEIYEDDAWKAENVQIKAGWIDSGNMATIAFTVTEDVNIKAIVAFVGGTEGTRLAVRIGVKDSEGILYNPPTYDDNGKVNNRLNVEKTYNLKAGDTIYFIFSNEANTDGCWPNGDLNITITKTEQQ